MKIYLKLNFAVCLIMLFAITGLQAGEIHEAVAAGDLNKVKTLLEADPTLLESRDGGGNTPLYIACIRQKVEIAHFLLDKGADVNAKNNWNQISLHAANGVMGQDLELIKRLIDRGADVNAMGNMGDIPLSWTAARGNLVVAEFLIDNGADPNAYNEAFGSILQNTINQGHQQMAKLLIEKGAKLNQKDPLGRTELHIATIAGNADFVKFLLDNNVELDVVDMYNRTALYYAAKLGYRGAFDILLAAGADKKLTDESNFGYAPQLSTTLKKGEAYFWYLGVDGYAVKTQNHLLMFDPPGGINESTEAGLANGHINPDELTGQKIRVFVSKPQWERYSLDCLELAKHTEDVDFVFSYKPEDKINMQNSVPPYHLAKPHESFAIGGVKVNVIPATLDGTAYLVEVDDMKIYFGGYHASKDASQDSSYRKEVDFLKTFGPIDVAILPVSGHLIPSYTYASHQYLVDQLLPKTVYLMHGFYDYSQYIKVSELISRSSVIVKYPEGGIAGNRFHYTRD